MAVFDFKVIQPVVPTVLLDKLRGLANSGNSMALAEDSKTQSFLLAGLTRVQLDNYLASEDEVGRLTHDLNNDGLIVHAELPGDIKNKQLVLILDQTTRSYLEKDIPALVKPDVKWAIFRLSQALDDDQVSTAHATLETTEDGKVLMMPYSKLADFFIDQTTNTSIKDEAVGVDITPPDDELVTGAEDDPDEDNVDLGVDESHLIASDDDTDPFGFDDDDFDDDDIFNDSGNDSAVKVEKPDYKPVTDIATDSEDDTRSSAIDEINEIDAVNANPDGFDEFDNDEELADDFEIPVDSKPDQGAAETGGLTRSINIAKPDALKVPVEIQDRIDMIKYPRLKRYPGTGKVVAELNQQVDRYNDQVAQREQLARNTVLDTYSTVLATNYKQTTAELDIQTGNDLIQSEYKKQVSREILQAEKDYDRELANKQQELEVTFMGKGFDDFKKSKEALFESQYRDEFYESRVTKPMADFKLEALDKLNDRKQAAHDQFYGWLNAVKDRSLAMDQVQAEKFAFLQGSKLSQTDLADIRTMQEALNKHSKEYIAYEYQQQAAADYASKLELIDHSKAELDRLNQAQAESTTELTKLNEQIRQLKHDLTLKDDQISTLTDQRDSAKRQLQSAQIMQQTMQMPYTTVQQPVYSQQSTPGMAMQQPAYQQTPQQPQPEPVVGVTPSAASGSDTAHKKSFFHRSR